MDEFKDEIMDGIKGFFKRRITQVTLALGGGIALGWFAKDYVKGLKERSTVTECEVTEEVSEIDEY